MAESAKLSFPRIADKKVVPEAFHDVSVGARVCGPQHDGLGRAAAVHAVRGGVVGGDGGAGVRVAAHEEEMIEIWKKMMTDKSNGVLIMHRPRKLLSANKKVII